MPSRGQNKFIRAGGAIFVSPALQRGEAAAQGTLSPGGTAHRGRSNHDDNVYGEAARSNVIRYIHRNPVVRGLVSRPEDWPWPSYRHYAVGVKGTVEIESQWTAFWRGNGLPEGVGVERREGARSRVVFAGNPERWATKQNADVV